MRDGEPVPWASWLLVGSDDPRSTFWTFVAEIHADYHRLWYPDQAPEEDGVSRLHQNCRRFVESRILRDVVGVTAALTDAESKAVIRDLSACGYRSMQADGAMHMDGPGCHIRLEPSARGIHGITELELAVDGAGVAGRTVELGGATLSFRSETSAVWEFGSDGGQPD